MKPSSPDDSMAVIVPCYNAGTLLLEAVESALAQTLTPHVIVCDDGSDDEETRRALADLREAAHERVRVVELDENRGISAARNKAIASTDATYLLFLDADDHLDPHYAQEALDILEADADVRIVSSPLQCFGAVDTLLRYGGAPRGVIDLLFENKIPASSVIRREDWERVGGFDESVRWAEDYDMWVRVLADGGVARELEQPRYFYRQHSSQLTSSMSPERIDELQLALVERHAEVWAAHVVDVMERYFQVQRHVRHYRSRYGWIESGKSRSVDLVRKVRHRKRR